MPESIILTHEEKKELLGLWRKLQTNVEEKVTASDYSYIKPHLDKAIAEGKITRDKFGLSPILLDLHTVYLVGKEIGYRREITLSILLNRCILSGAISLQEVTEKFGENVTNILKSLAQINSLHAKTPQ